MLTAGGVWVEPDPELLALAVECDAVVFGRRAESDDLAPRLAAVLGDGWEPPFEGGVAVTDPVPLRARSPDTNM